MTKKTEPVVGTVSLSERDFQQQVLGFARLCGWFVYWTWKSIHSPAGFPDLVLARGSRLIFAELKTDKGVLTVPQREWLWALGLTCAEVYVWRPACWSQIERTLRR